MLLDGSPVSEGFRWRDCGLRFAIVASSLGLIGVRVSFWLDKHCTFTCMANGVCTFRSVVSLKQTSYASVTLSYTNLHQHPTPNAPIQTCKYHI